LARFVYSEDYYVDIGEHVFPMEKYRLIHQRLLKEGFRGADFIKPGPAKDEDILLVHTEDYVQKLKTGTLSPSEILILELPCSPDLVRASWLGAGGTILAARNALKDGLSMNIAGGFHHAFPDHGEGFCVLNDVAIAIRCLQKDKEIEKALVIDCDLHQGNGTAVIFQEDEAVFTFSIHQENNYPPKEKSDLDIGLPDGADDELYLSHLKDNVSHLFEEFKPDLALYLAGADPYRGDQLGGLALSIEGLKERDRIVIGEAREKKVPLAAVLAGGYALDKEDTVTIHSNTARVIKEKAGALRV
jgi:acetoin utilization deacetylase AcuC-like enzyme